MGGSGRGLFHCFISAFTWGVGKIKEIHSEVFYEPSENARRQKDAVE